MRIGSNGTRVEAVVHLRDAAPEGTVFLQAGLGGDGSANLLDGPLVEIEKA